MAKTLTARVVKAISLLGSSQMLNMFCGMLRGKLLTVIVGPFGVGLAGVLNQTVDLVANITQLNIRTSAVRDLAIIPPAHRGKTIGIVRRVSRALGWLGMLLMFAFAPLLSRLTLDTVDYANAFRIASVALLLQAMQGSEQIVLQAEGRIKEIASASLITAVSGLLMAIPLYKLFMADGVAPSIVAYGLAGWMVAAWYTRRFRSSAADTLSLRECFACSRSFIVTGFYLMVVAITANIVSLAFLAVVKRHMGGVELGLYQAGNTMLVRYVGVFFVALTLEFYPRISAASTRPRYAKLLMTHQANICTALFFPCAVAAMLLAPWLIRLLYNSEFLPMSPYFVYGLAGMMLRPASMVLSYGLLATNNMKSYLFTEILSSAIGFGFCLSGYLIGGWTGLGIASTLWYLADILIIYITCRLINSPTYPVRTLIFSISCTAALFLLAGVLN